MVPSFRHPRFTIRFARAELRAEEPEAPCATRSEGLHWEERDLMDLMDGLMDLWTYGLNGRYLGSRGLAHTSGAEWSLRSHCLPALRKDTGLFRERVNNPRNTLRVTTTPGSWPFCSIPLSKIMEPF